MNRNTAMIATGATALLCGCPGLFSCFFGLIMALAGMVPGSEIDILGSSDPTMAIGAGLGAICGGLILILIPVAVGFFTLRNAPAS
jgi:hypothetical protein